MAKNIFYEKENFERPKPPAYQGFLSFNNLPDMTNSYAVPGANKNQTKIYWPNIKDSTSQLRIFKLDLEKEKAEILPIALPGQFSEYGTDHFLDKNDNLYSIVGSKNLIKINTNNDTCETIYTDAYLYSRWFANSYNIIYNWYVDDLGNGYIPCSDYGLNFFIIKITADGVITKINTGVLANFYQKDIFGNIYYFSKYTNKFIKITRDGQLLINTLPNANLINSVIEGPSFINLKTPRCDFPSDDAGNLYIPYGNWDLLKINAVTSQASIISTYTPTGMSFYPHSIWSIKEKDDNTWHIYYLSKVKTTATYWSLIIATITPNGAVTYYQSPTRNSLEHILLEPTRTDPINRIYSNSKIISLHGKLRPTIDGTSLVSRSENLSIVPIYNPSNTESGYDTIFIPDNLKISNNTGMIYYHSNNTSNAIFDYTIVDNTKQLWNNYICSYLTMDNSGQNTYVIKNNEVQYSLNKLRYDESNQLETTEIISEFGSFAFEDDDGNIFVLPDQYSQLLKINKAEDSLNIEKIVVNPGTTYKAKYRLNESPPFIGKNIFCKLSLYAEHHTTQCIVIKTRFKKYLADDYNFDI